MCIRDRGWEAAAGGQALTPLTRPNPPRVQAMQGIMQNPEFAKMAENLGKKMFESDPQLAGMIGMQSNPEVRAKMEERMRELKDDPTIAPIIQDLETGGPGAMMKCVGRV